jgi:hypothetical protein
LKAVCFLLKLPFSWDVQYSWKWGQGKGISSLKQKNHFLWSYWYVRSFVCVSSKCFERQTIWKVEYGDMVSPPWHTVWLLWFVCELAEHVTITLQIGTHQTSCHVASFFLPKLKIARKGRRLNDTTMIQTVSGHT